MKRIKMMFGSMEVTPQVANRLADLGYTPEELQDVINSEMTHDDGNAPMVYVGTYGKYAAGILRGLWVRINFMCDYSDFIDFCKAIHADEDNPELMLQDYECFPREWYDECPNEESFNNILRYSELCEQYSKDAVDAFIGWGCEDLEHFEDCYCGEYNSEEDFAREIVNDCYDLDKKMGDLSYYFDYAAFARDLFTTDYTFDAATGAVFRR